MKKNEQTTLQQIAERVDGLLVQSAADTQSLETKLTAQIGRLEEARERAAEALASGDEAAYHKARSEQRAMQDSVDLFLSRLEALTESPLITQGEYESLVADILAELAEHVAGAKNEISRLADEMQTVSDRSGAEIEEGNRLMDDLRVKIAKIEPYTVEPDGTRHRKAVNSKRKFKDYSVQHYVRVLKENSLYVAPEKR